MILFVFEGERREPEIFRALQRLFFSGGSGNIVCSFGNNIYQLNRELREYEGFGDLTALLAEKYRVHGLDDNPFEGLSALSDISEIYLFFDYDIQNSNLSVSQMNERLLEMLEMFNDETGPGKLYVNYPMVESIRYTQALPDLNYWTYSVTRGECRVFKRLSSEFSFYKNFSFIIPANRVEEPEIIEGIKRNWKILTEQNVRKANYMCNKENSLPQSKDSVNQKSIFKSQLEYYLPDGRVAVLSSIPLFLYEYFKDFI